MLDEKERRLDDIRGKSKLTREELEARLNEEMDKTRKLQAELQGASAMMKQNVHERDLTVLKARSEAEIAANNMIENLNGQLQQLKNQLKDRDRTVVELKEEISGLNNRLASLAASYDKARGELEQALHGAEGQVVERELMLRSVRSDHKQQLADLEAKIAEQGTTIEHQNASLQQMQQAIDDKTREGRALQDALRESKKQTETALDTANRVRAQLSEKEAMIALRQSEIGTINEKLNRQTELLETAKAQHAITVQELRALLGHKDEIIEQAKAEYSRSIGAAEAANAKLRQDADILKQNMFECGKIMQQLEAERNQLAIDLESERGRVQGAGKTIADLQSQLEEAKDAETRALSRLEAMDAKMKLQQAMMESLKREQEQALADLQAANQEKLRVLDARLEQQGKLLQEQTQKAAQQQEVIHELETELQAHALNLHQQTRDRDIQLGNARSEAEQSMNAVVERANAQISQLKTQVKDRENTMAQQQESIKLLTTKLEAGASAAEKLRQESARQCQELEAQLADKEQALRALAAENKQSTMALEARLAEQVRVVQDQVQTAEALKRAMEEKARDYRNLQRELEGARNSIDTHLATVSKLQLQLSDKEAQLLSRDGELDIHREKLDKQTALLETARREHTKAITQARSLMGEKERLERMQTQDHSDTLDGLERTIQTLEAALEKERAENAQRLANEAALRNENARLKQDLELQTARAGKSSDKVTQLTAQVMEGEAVLQRLESERDLAEEKLEKLQGMLDASKREHDSIVERLHQLLKDRETRSVVDCENYNRRLAELQAQLRGLNEEIDAREHELAEKTDALDLMGREREQLTRHVQDESARVQQLAESYATAQDRNRELEQQLASRDSELITLRSKLELQQAVQDALRNDGESTIKDLQARLDAATRSGKDDETKQRDLSMSMEVQLRMERATREAQAQEFAQGMSATQAELLERTRECEQLKERLAGTERDFQRANAALADIMSSRQHKDDELQRAKSELGEAHSLLQNARGDYTARIRDLENMLGEKAKTLAELRADYGAEMQQLRAGWEDAVRAAKEKDVALQALEERVRALQRDNEMLSRGEAERIRSRDLELSRATTLHKDLTSSIDSLNADVDSLRGQLQAARSQIEALEGARQECAALRTAKVQLEALADDLQNQLQMLRNSMASKEQGAGQQRQLLEQQKQALEQQIAQLATQLQTEQQAARQLQAQLQALAQQKDTERDNAVDAAQRQAKADLAQLQAQREADAALAAASLADKTKLIDELEATLALTKAQLGEVQSRAQQQRERSMQDSELQVMALRGQVTDLTAQVDDLQSALTAKTRHAQELEALVTQLQGQLGESELHLNRQRGLEQEQLHQLELLLKEKQAEIANITQHHEQTEMLLQQTIDGQKQQIDSLKELLSAHSGQEDANHALSAQLQGKEAELQQLRQQRDALQADKDRAVAELSAARDAAEAQCERLRQQLRELQQSNEDSLAQVNGELEQANAALEQVKAQLEQAKSELLQARSELEQARSGQSAGAEQAARDLEASQRRVEELTLQISTMTKRIEELNIQITVHGRNEDRIKELEDKLDEMTFELEAEKAKWNLRASGDEATIKALKEQIAALEEELRRLRMAQQQQQQQQETVTVRTVTTTNVS